MFEKTYITGLGIISAIGDNTEQNLQSLLNKKSGISKIELLDTVHKDDFVAGEIKHTNEELSKLLNIEYLDYPRATLLGMIAAREAYNNAEIEDSGELHTGIIAGTTVGGMDKTEKYYKNTGMNTEFIRAHNCGYCTERIAELLNITEYASSVSTACSSAANAILFGSMLIRHNILDRVIAGGMDCLSKFTLNGFNTLYILDKDQCKPFDKNRKGLNLGEGAGFVVIESEKSIMRKSKDPICELTGYANSNDAYHQTALSPDAEGPYLSMKKALETGNVQEGDIDYINMHGTGTENNDITEVKALKRLFGEDIPKFSSTKSFTGHTLGAAGGIEAIYSILAMKYNFIPPNINYNVPMEELSTIIPVTEVVRDVKLKHVLSNSFGFGGNDSTLLFSNLK